MVDSPPTLRRLIGVYDADGTVLGELAYFVKARVGKAHCALCDITHGRVRERADWRAARQDLPVEFVTYHRDDQPDAVRTAIGDRLPAVVAETSEGITVLLDGDGLDACAGDPEAHVSHLRTAIDARGFIVPARPDEPTNCS